MSKELCDSCRYRKEEVKNVRGTLFSYEREPYCALGNKINKYGCHNYTMKQGVIDKVLERLKGGEEYGRR
jgi:hypothetical protein